MPAPALSVVIPAYNQAATLRRTLEALEQQTLDPHLYEVIVVDDGSTDETAALVRGRSAEDPRVHLLQHGTNRGRSAARNSGIRTARGEIVVLIDSDILVRPDFLAHHLDAHRRSLHPVLCRGPVVDLPDGRLPEKPPALATSPAYLTTANASLPRQELLAAGLFDENFPAYGWEDFDMGFRLQRRGLPRVFRREAVAFHIIRGVDTQTLEQALRKEEERARSAVYLYARHPDWRTRLLIQYTLLHRILYFVLAGGGLLNPRTAPILASRLRRRGRNFLAETVIRGALNRHYLGVLRREWARARRGTKL